MHEVTKGLIWVAVIAAGVLIGSYVLSKTSAGA